MNDVDISKYLSYVLRHKPDAIGITLDPNGYVKTDVLLDAAKKDGKNLSQADLYRVVQNNDKKRFEYSPDGLSIRAAQGHSNTVAGMAAPVDLGLASQIPPDVLYHGTTGKAIDDIKKTGLEKRKRTHVHLSKDINTAITVGSRHGKPVILVIDTKKMVADGYKFYLSSNGVWLVDAVPVQYITFP